MSQSLYRFFSFNDNSIRSLNELYLYFSKLVDFNDPFEGTNSRMVFKRKINEFTDGDFIELQRFFSKSHNIDIEKRLKDLYILGGKELVEEEKGRTLDELYSIFIRGYETINDDCFCCFAQDIDKPALKNKLMWSHYSDGMRGFCIEFDKIKLIDSLSKKNDQIIGMMPITYSDFYNVDVVNSALELIRSHEEGVKITSEASKAVTVKPKEWSYENEFRLSLKGNYGHFELDCIKSITFGFKADESKIAQVVSSLSASDIEFKIAKLADDSFDIDLTSYVV